MDIVLYAANGIECMSEILTSRNYLYMFSEMDYVFYESGHIFIWFDLFAG